MHATTTGNQELGRTGEEVDQLRACESHEGVTKSASLFGRSSKSQVQKLQVSICIACHDFRNPGDKSLDKLPRWMRATSICAVVCTAALR